MSKAVCRGDRTAGRRAFLPGVLILIGLVAVLSLTGCGRVRSLMPRPNLYASEAADPFQAVPVLWRSNRVDVLYATDRSPERKGEELTGYGHDRSMSWAFGSCVVEIGDDLSWEGLTGRSLQRRRVLPLRLSVESIEEKGRFPETPIALVLAGDGLREAPDLVAQREEMAEAFRKEVAARLAVTPVKEAYVFIHGFNETLSDAAFVMAELWHYMGRCGLPVVYSWPAGSGGMLFGYTHDRESGEFSIFHLKEFLHLLASCPDLEKIHLLMHSRGTDVGASALREMVIEARGAGEDFENALKIGNVVLLAPDLDVQVATQRFSAERIPLAVDRVTVYVSKSDRMMALSAWLFQSVRRLGQLSLPDLKALFHTERSGVAGLDVIEADIRSDFKGHTYFRTHPAASSDLILLLRDNSSPGAANGRPLIEVDSELRYWVLKDDYPN